MQGTVCNAGDVASVLGSGASPGEGNGHQLQYFCLENSMDREDWRATVLGVTRAGHDSATKTAPAAAHGEAATQPQVSLSLSASTAGRASEGRQPLPSARLLPSCSLEKAPVSSGSLLSLMPWGRHMSETSHQGWSSPGHQYLEVRHLPSGQKTSL